jgi:hypothetical protein
VSILIFSACEKVDNPITNPNQLLKDNSDLYGSTPDESNYEIIPLPPKSPIYLDSIFTISVPIIGELGGRIVLDKFYVDTAGHIVTMLADLTIPKDAFYGLRIITLTIDNNYAAVKCEPKMKFWEPLKLDQTFTGLDLSGYQTGRIDFVYISDNGQIENIPNNGVIIIKPLGIVMVRNARLNHFSLYGWVRRH